MLRRYVTRACIAAVVVSSVCGVAPPMASSTAAGSQDDFPTMAGEAMRYYEGRIDDWTSGPAEMLMTVEEHEIWSSLEDDQQRQDFKRWFWYRRDPDGRQIGNSYQENFYERVADANKLYRGFPRGWKSDRGRAHCILGAPDAKSRRSWASIFGSGNGPDFEVWSYYSLTGGRAFTAQSGEFNIYFSEQRIGQFEIYDFRWGAGVWERNIRLAMEWTIDAGIIDPIEPFESGSSEGEFVREISEGTLPVAIPLGLWGPSGGGGMVSLPVELELGDLLFESEGEQFVARLEATMSVEASGSGNPRSVSQAWQVRLGQEQLVAVGSGQLVTALSLAAEPGNHQATIVVQHPLASAESEWSQEIEVSDEPSAGMVVGKLVLDLDPDDPSAVAVVAPSEATFEGGSPLVVGIWARGAELAGADVSVHLESLVGGAHELVLDEVRWVDGGAGPLLIESRLPEVEPGEYRLQVYLGTELDDPSATITVSR